MGIMTLLSDGDSFNPRRLFAATTQGAIYDYDDFAYLYQKSDGSTPVTALEQPVGLMLDKRFWGLAALGSERVTNGSFANGSTGWSLGTGWAITGGAAVKTAGVSDLLQQTSVIPTSGWCRVSFTATRTAGTCYVRLGGNTNQYSIVQSGSYAIFLPVQGVDQTLRFVADASFAGSIDDVSVKQLPGLHAYQSTDAARPVLKGTPRYTLFDRTDDHLLLATGGGSTTGFMLAGSIQPASAGTARTIFSDRGTNTGYKVEIDASNNLLFTAGNGTAFTTCTGPTLTAGTNYAFCVWHDGTNLNIKVGTAAVVQQAFATATAGTSTVTLFKDNAAASGYFSGRLYALTFIRNAAITEGIASQLIGWAASKGGFAP